MEESPISYKKTIVLTIISLIIVILTLGRQWWESGTKIVFCDVGEGDAAYIKVNNKIDILIDAGPDKSVLQCLGKYMPLYDRKIEYAILSHPQMDHYAGFNYVLEHYDIQNFLMLPLDNQSRFFQNLKNTIKNKKIKIIHPVAGSAISILDSTLYFHWPSNAFLTSNILYENHQGNVLGVSSLDDNNFSIMFSFSEKNHKVLFTGDISPKILSYFQGKQNIKSDVLKIPHHGSKNGLTKQFLQLANPALAVISVGKKNSYGHPSKEVLNMLKALKINYLRTDEEGDIIYKIKSQNSKLKNTTKNLKVIKYF